MKDYLEDEVDEKYYINSKRQETNSEIYGEGQEQKIQ